MLKETYKIPTLPPSVDFDTIAILKALNDAARRLAEVKGRALIIPNQGILIDTLTLQEAKESSEIERIVTTNDELFKASFQKDTGLIGPAKEVAMYRDALRLGHERLLENGSISNRTIIDMFRILKNRTNGFRTLPGTALQNDFGDIVFVPPQHRDDIQRHMGVLESYIDAENGLDPLIKMAIIHHQFESIHPFPDGNGRIGRILNVLYLTKTGLLDIPILYLSRGINRRKSEYYQLLQKVRDEGAWEEWVIYILELISEAADITLRLIEAIRQQMSYAKIKLREHHPKIYSQDLINNLFRHPYTRIEFVMKELGVSRPTARSYLEQIAANEEIPITKMVEGRNNYYVNVGLLNLLSEIDSKATQ